MEASQLFADEENTAPKQAKGSYEHPVALVFHLLFRGTAILVYLFCGWFSSSFVTNFVVIIVLLSLDFWTVKNITGRLLAGLRWWNYVDEEGKSHWVFESKKDTSTINSFESYIFWFGLIVFTVVWALFFFIALFRLEFSWAMVVVIALMLNGANLYGYIRCKIQSRERLTSMATGLLSRDVFKKMLFSTPKTNEDQKHFVGVV